MNPFTYIKSFFAASECPSPVTPSQVPPPAPPVIEPSCLAKGITQAWLTRDDWTTKRKIVTVQYYGSGGYGPHTYYDVWLNNAILGIKIRVNEPLEWFEYSRITLGDVIVSGKVELPESHYSRERPDQSDVDRTYILAAINTHPYPALKKILDKREKDKNKREARLRALEKLGCPAKESTQS